MAAGCGWLDLDVPGPSVVSKFPSGCLSKRFAKLLGVSLLFFWTEKRPSTKVVPGEFFRPSNRSSGSCLRSNSDESKGVEAVSEERLDPVLLPD